MILKLRNTWFLSGYVSFALGDSVSSHLENIHPNDMLRLTGEVEFPITISACNKLYIISENMTRACFNDSKLCFTYSTLTNNNKNALGIRYVLVANNELALAAKCKHENILQNYYGNKSQVREVTILDSLNCKRRS